MDVFGYEYIFEDLDSLRTAYGEGDKNALHVCVIHCYQAGEPIPEWALSELAKKSQFELAKRLSKSLGRERYNSLITAAIMAVKESKLTSNESEVCTLAEALLSITNFHSKHGEAFTQENIKKTYGRIKKKVENNGELLVHADALEKFILKLEQLPGGLSVVQIEDRIKNMEKFDLPF